MQVLISGAFAFFLLHRLVSAGPLREPLVRQVGETNFQRLFGLASLVCFVWLNAGYWLASDHYSTHLWSLDMPVWVEWFLQLVASFFITAGVVTPNPATTGMGDRVRDPDIVRGILRITRHPFLWGAALMSLVHAAARPDMASLAYFGTLAFLAVTGTLSIDHKLRRRLGAAWVDFAARTSNIPFAAVLSGQQRVKLNEIGWRPVAYSFALFAVIMAAHVGLGANFG